MGLEGFEEVLPRELFPSTWVPLVKEVHRRVLAQGHLREEEALEALQVRFPQAEARRVWRRLLEWGRFAGLFAYDEPSRTLYPPRAA